MKILTTLLVSLFLFTTACKKGNGSISSEDSTATDWQSQGSNGSPNGQSDGSFNGSSNNGRASGRIEGPTSRTGRVVGPTATRECPAQTNLRVEGQNLNPTTFKIKKVIVVLRNDSTVKFYMLNYDVATFDKNALTAGQIAIEVALRRRGGMLESGNYVHGVEEAVSHYALVTVYSQGANPQAGWREGDESPALVELYSVNGNRLCGHFDVDQGEYNTHPGYKLNGDFVVQLP